MQVSVFPHICSPRQTSQPWKFLISGYLVSFDLSLLSPQDIHRNLLQASLMFSWTRCWSPFWTCRHVTELQRHPVFDWSCVALTEPSKPGDSRFWGAEAEHPKERLCVVYKAVLGRTRSEWQGPQSQTHHWRHPGQGSCWRALCRLYWL